MFYDPISTFFDDSTGINLVGFGRGSRPGDADYGAGRSDAFVC